MIDGDIGLGLLDVRHKPGQDDWDRRFEGGDATDERNEACSTRVASKGPSGASTG